MVRSFIRLSAAAAVAFAALTFGAAPASAVTINPSNSLTVGGVIYQVTNCLYGVTVPAGMAATVGAQSTAQTAGTVCGSGSTAALNLQMVANAGNNGVIFEYNNGASPIDSANSNGLTTTFSTIPTGDVTLYITMTAANAYQTISSVSEAIVGATTGTGGSFGATSQAGLSLSASSSTSLNATVAGGNVTSATLQWDVRSSVGTGGNGSAGITTIALSATVPEPASMALMSVALLGLGLGFARRRALV